MQAKGLFVLLTRNQVWQFKLEQFILFLSFVFFHSAQIRGLFLIAEFDPFLTAAIGVVQNKGSCEVGGKQTVSYNSVWI